jgi:hypothetical protein
MSGRDLSAELFGTEASKSGGRDLSAELFPKQEPGLFDRIKAGVTGVNKGFYADLLGLPVDTVANVIDLGKAAVGTAASAVGRHDLAPDLTDRAKVVGSSQWIERKLNDVGVGAAVNNPNPDDKASRIVHTGGRVAGASVFPVRGLTGAQQAANMAKGGVSGMIAGAVGEDNPEWAGLAGMAPQVLGAAAPWATRAAFGGDKGRATMQQRMADLKAGGIDDPSVGLATGNRTVQGLENMLSQTPGSIGLYERASAKNVAGMQAKTAALRDSLSPEYGAQVTGEAIQGSIKNNFVDRFKSTQGNLYDALDKLIPKNTRMPVNSSADALQRLTAGIEGAPNLGERFINGRISGINDSFRLDSGLEMPSGPRRTTTDTRPASPEQVIPRGEGTPLVMPARPAMTVKRSINPYYPNAGEGTWKPPETPMLPYQAVKQLRSEVGAELNSNSLVSDVPRGQWKQLYAGLSEDMRGVANSTGPQASQAFNRANTYTKRGMTRMEDLDSLANRDTPEGAYKAVASSLKSGSTVYDRLRGALTPDARQKVVATVIDDLGAATPGNQNAAGDVWSPRTFLTNYSKMEDGARAALFKRIPGGDTMSGNLGKIAKTAEMLSESSKIWSNPSGTAPALVARGTIGTIGAGAIGGIFYTPLIAPAAVAAGGLVGANQLSQRLLLNPKFVNWLAKAPPVRTQAEALAYSQRLIANARLTNDPQFTQDVGQYLQSVHQPQDE